MKTNTAIQAPTQKVIFSNSYRNRKQATENQTITLKNKREELKKLSEPISKKFKKGKIESVNVGLKAIYAKQGHTELKSLKEWNKAGFKVKKGEHALLLWGKKKTSLSESETYKFNPICFVFSQLQIEEKNS